MHDENLALWELLLLVLRALDHGEPNLDVLLRWFELHLLGVAGFQPELFYCLYCSDELQPVTNYLSISEGGIYCPRCGEARKGTEPLDVGVLKVLRYLQSHGWSQVSKLSVRPEVMGPVENILYRYLLSILERQLKSVNFLRSVARSG